MLGGHCYEKIRIENWIERNIQKRSLSQNQKKNLIHKGPLTKCKWGVDNVSCPIPIQRLDVAMVVLHLESMVHLQAG